MSYKKYKKYNDNNIHTFNINNKIFIDKFENIFKPVYLYGEKSRYVVDIMGNVYNIKKKNCHKMTPIFSSGGYYRVYLSHKNKKSKLYSVHRIVALAFIENIDNKPDVNHKDGNKSHNYASNLEWVTKSENVLHAYRNNLNSNKGEINPKAKLSEKDVEEIWNIINSSKNNISFTDIGKKYNVSKTAISNIYHGNTWNHLYKKYSVNEKDFSKKYDDDIIKKAKEMIKKSELSMKEISKITGIKLNYLYHIKLNNYRKDI